MTHDQKLWFKQIWSGLLCMINKGGLIWRGCTQKASVLHNGNHLIFEVTETCLALNSLMVKCTSCLSLYGHIERWFVFASFWTCGLARAAVHSRDVSVVTIKQVLVNNSQPAPMSQTRSFKPTAAASSSLLVSDSAGPPTTGLNTGQLSGRQLWFAFKQQPETLLLSLCLSFISLCLLHIYFPSPNSLSCACCFAFTRKPHNHKTHPQWICWHSARQPALSGEGSNLVVVFKPRRGDFKVFESIEQSYCGAFEAVIIINLNGLN